MRGHYGVEVMTQNFASFKRGWPLRAVVLVARVLLHKPGVLTCTELYAAKRWRITRALKSRYVFAGSYNGKAIYVRRDIGVHRGSLLRINLRHGKHALAVRCVDPATGTRFVVVVAHLSWRHEHDDRRHTETHRLITAVRKRFGSTPAIYTGDFNSSIVTGARKRDAVGDVFKDRGLIEAYRTASTRTNQRWNSANRYKRPAPHSFIHLDRVFGQGVTFTSWLLDFYDHGRYGSDHFGVVVVVHIPLKEGTS